MGNFPAAGAERDGEILRSSNLNSYLTSLPTIFQYVEAQISDSAAQNGSNQNTLPIGNGQSKLKSIITRNWICSFQPKEKEKNISFTATDGSKVYYKPVSLDELREMKNTLERGESSIPWWQFFTAVKKAFKKKLLELNFVIHNNVEIAKLTMELQLSPKLGKGTITLNLRLANEIMSGIIIREAYLSPLFLTYKSKASLNTSITELEEEENVLESQLKIEREKNQALQQELNLLRRKQFSQSSILSLRSTNSLANLNQSSNSINSPTNNEDDISFPAEPLQKYIKSFRHKLLNSKILTQKQLDEFEEITLILSKKNTLIYTDEAENDKDKEMLSFIKEKFTKRKKKRVSNNEEDSTTEAPVPSSLNPNEIKPTVTLSTLLDQIDKWNFDVFALDALTDGHPLLICGYTLFVKHDLITKLKIPEDTLIHTLRAFEYNYHANPYHNCIHASDVTQVMHSIIKKGDLIQFLSTEDIFAAIFACLVHDLDHPGLNNAYQTNAQTYLATLYNERAILENHHVSYALEITRLKQYNIFCNLSSSQLKDVRETIIGMVLATDMGDHTKYINKFRQRLEADADFTIKEDVRLALQVAIKLSDVSNPTRPLNIYLNWTEKVMEEFFNQGDVEREMGLQVVPLMDRRSAHIARGQQAFINFVVQPMFQLLTLLLPKMKFAEEYIAENLKYWNTHDTI